MLLKNQFWIALGGAGVLLLALIAILFLGPAKRAANARTAYEDFKKDLEGKQDFKNSHFVEPWDKRKEVFTGRKNEVWGAAYRTQDGLMTWPFKDKESSYSNFQKLGQAGHFGDTISNDDLLAYKEKLYKTQFPTRAEDLYLFLAPDGGDAYLPVTFYRKLFNPVPWEKDKVPTVEEAWLAQEEIWLRREVFHLLQT